MSESKGAKGPGSQVTDQRVYRKQNYVHSLDLERGSR